MSIRFEKMHAIGNDFVMINYDDVFDKSILSPSFYKSVSNRTHGIGCDTVIVYRYENGIAFTSFFNSDGSEAEICGNGARCIGLLLNKKYGIKNCILKTKTRDYPIIIDDTVSVDMGRPSFAVDDIGLVDSLDTLQKEFSEFKMFCISVGNPHLVLFPIKTFSEDEIKSIGAKFESHPIFKNRINVSFAYVKSKNEIELSVFERGVGLTQACGSGACATAYIAYKNGFVDTENIAVIQKGGVLKIHIDKHKHIWQSGSATYVFRGEL
ncbi:MAG: diaminopimelate epimerase [Alphaproteobacteria bacterium]|nr:diaminopimelate epimerase [Alphaproteobacteria bacterium]